VDEKLLRIEELAEALKVKVATLRRWIYAHRIPFVYAYAAAEATGGDMARARNLSEGGACLDFPEALDPGTHLSLRLPESASALTVDAAVVWIGPPSLSGGPTQHGVAFPALTADQRAALGRFLRLGGGLAGPDTRRDLTLGDNRDEPTAGTRCGGAEAGGGE
jgi:hypothetical protein